MKTKAFLPKRAHHLVAVPLLCFLLGEPPVWSSGSSRREVSLHEARGNPGHPVIATRRRLKAGLPAESMASTSSRSQYTGSKSRPNRDNGADQTGAGVVEGRVTFQGEVPKAAVADDAGARRDLLQVDRISGGLRD